MLYYVTAIDAIAVPIYKSGLSLDSKAIQSNSKQFKAIQSNSVQLKCMPQCAFEKKSSISYNRISACSLHIQYAENARDLKS